VRLAGSTRAIAVVLGTLLAASTTAGVVLGWTGQARPLAISGLGAVLGLFIATWFVVVFRAAAGRSRR
jgi:hypothetical protein